MPDGAMYVGRPTIFGNPWRVEDVGQVKAVYFYRLWLGGLFPANGVAGGLRRVTILGRLDELRGKDLACWCPIENRHGIRVPCHADVLLDLANRTEP
jgi:hypothetical protein